MPGIILAIVILFYVLSIYVKWKVKKNKEKYDSNVEELLKVQGVNGEKLIVTEMEIYEGLEYEKYKILSIDEQDKKVIVIDFPNQFEWGRNFKKPQIQRIDFKDIIVVKVQQKSKTLISTSRGSQLGRAGIGGLSGKTNSNKFRGKLSLEIGVNSISNPIVEIPVYNSKTELGADILKDDEITEVANLWYRKITVILYQQDQLQIQDLRVLLEREKTTVIEETGYPKTINE